MLVVVVARAVLVVTVALVLLVVGAVRVLVNLRVVVVVEVLVGLFVLDVNDGQCSEGCGSSTLYYLTHRGFLESVLFLSCKQQ